VDEAGRGGTDEDAQHAPQCRHERRFHDHAAHDRPRRDPQQPHRRDVATALATIVMTPIARWKRLTTRKVCELSTAMSRDRCARNPNAAALMAPSAESLTASLLLVATANRSTR